MADFTYMGSKKLLAPQIADLVADMANGPFLDLFSGIAAVGSQIGTQRSIWSNDVQSFSTLLTGQKFRAARPFRTAHSIIERAEMPFAINRTGLEATFSEALANEERALSTNDAEGARELIATMSQIDEKISTLRRQKVHCLFTGLHGATYLGIRQAIDLDSIRYAADHLIDAGEVTAEEHRWMVLALCQTISTVSNSTGHFAQYLYPSYANIRRVVRKRRLNCWSIWSTALRESRPLGYVAWRRSNRVFKSDATTLLKKLSRNVRQPAVIYADPPYTSDQYSRYYHVLENAVLYDYPKVSSKGQYRPDRFTSGFSLKAGVDGSFKELVSAAAKLPSVFILSYPTNGLLKDSTERVLELLLEKFAHVDQPLVIPHLHSTMGGSKGAQKQAVDENIFVAYQDPLARWHGKDAGGALASRRTGPAPIAEVEDIAA
ncbi:DNA adenine methylase [Mesorhizobium sp. WSM2561]|uniref:DNA adenine methylase n=1 Tax=Mesorhizobium sp. WSM2561 TaxID=1040985 RepID=UPI0012EBE401|nr:DNA adenine methylase [Mesorhizobium sp. WSM2561]